MCRHMRLFMCGIGRISVTSVRTNCLRACVSQTIRRQRTCSAQPARSVRHLHEWHINNGHTYNNTRARAAHQQRAAQHTPKMESKTKLISTLKTLSTPAMFSTLGPRYAAMSLKAARTGSPLPLAATTTERAQARPGMRGLSGTAPPQYHLGAELR